MAGIKKHEVNATEVQVEMWDIIRTKNVGIDLQGKSYASQLL
jgi:hypothetical protein